MHFGIIDYRLRSTLRLKAIQCLRAAALLSHRSMYLRQAIASKGINSECTTHNL